MKKIFTFTILFLFSVTLFAQDNKGSDLKNFRFGGTILPSLFWYKPDNLKKFASNGAVAKFGVLINGEYSFSGNFAFGFGLGLASAGGKITFTDTANYYFNDDAIISLADTTGLKGKYEYYKLNNRAYNASYFIIPLSLKMRTNEIGYMRYFFQPSINIGFRKKIRANDDLCSYKTKQPLQQTDLDITKDMNFFRLSTTMSAGGEYYLSGSTAVVFAIGYDYGLSNVTKDSKYLIRTDSKPVEQKFIQHGVVLTLGILF
ncbi:MAG: outer membrane beta-barrel protein [Bacteroidota bacterium]